MRKVLFVLGAAAIMFATSCNKEKDCKCTTSSSDPLIQDIETTTTIEDGECSDGNSTATTAGITVTVECVEQ